MVKAYISSTQPQASCASLSSKMAVLTFIQVGATRRSARRLISVGALPVVWRVWG